VWVRTPGLQSYASQPGLQCPVVPEPFTHTPSSHTPLLLNTGGQHPRSVSAHICAPAQALADWTSVPMNVPQQHPLAPVLTVPPHTFWHSVKPRGGRLVSHGPASDPS